MTTTSPLVFRPSLLQRTLTALLFAGSWLVGIRGMILLFTNLPKVLANLHQSQALGEPTARWWTWLVASFGLGLAGGLLMLLTVMGVILVEGTHILVDEVGITVDHAGLPRTLAIRFGAGHLPWKQVVHLEKGKLFFIIRGGLPQGEPDSLLARHYANTTLKFLVVEELERLIHIILERSSNLTFS